jgi:hypothetical protein
MKSAAAFAALLAGLTSARDTISRTTEDTEELRKVEFHWDPQTYEAWGPYGGRQAFVHVVHVDPIDSVEKSYVMGGRTAIGIAGDIWASPDRVKWGEVILSEPAWPGRYLFGGSSLGDRIVVMGGMAGGGLGLTNDVWESSDGARTWRQLRGKTPASDATMWSPRMFFSTAIHNGDLYLSGGNANAQYLDDIWRGDGRDLSQWTRLDVPGDGTNKPVARAGHGFISYGGHILLMGGLDLTRLYNDVWEYDADRSEFTQVRSPPLTYLRRWVFGSL